MIKKTMLFSALIACSAFSLASTPEERAAQEKENMRMLEELGLPLPGSGIKIVPRAMLNLSPEAMQKGEKELAEFKEKGYVDKYINRPLELLAITKRSVKKAVQTLNGKPSNRYTGFVKNVSDLKLGFTFPTLTQNKSLRGTSQPIKILAATVQGGFHDDKGGWSGAAEYFTYKDIGTCSYGIMNVKVSNTAAQLAQEDVTYTINNKATILMPVEGSDNSGYLYMVKWYDDENFHELECANMKYAAKINDAVIELAKKIDKN